jgi:hypothetical protein
MYIVKLKFYETKHVSIRCFNYFSNISVLHLTEEKYFNTKNTVDHF